MRFSAPLNQSNEGVGDEITNSFRWRKAPQLVRRMALRHPTKSEDAKIVKEMTSLIRWRLKNLLPASRVGFSGV